MYVCLAWLFPVKDPVSTTYMLTCRYWVVERANLRTAGEFISDIELWRKKESFIEPHPSVKNYTLFT